MKKNILPVSLICICSNVRTYENCLSKSYEAQNVECDLVYIDNTRNQFKNAVSAIQYGLTKAKHTSIIIVHQDIIFLDTNTLEQIGNRILHSQDELIGVIGVTYENRALYGSVFHSEKRIPAWNFLVSANSEKEVFALDECLFGFKTSILQKISFDEKTCNNWHFYAVDLCYQAALNNTKVIVFGANLWHLSTGTPNRSFFKTLARMRRKYRHFFDKIVSCCIEVRMDRPLLQYKLRPVYHKIRHSIRCLLKLE